MIKNKIILGSIVGLFSFMIIVYVIESERSFLQLIFGFIMFIIPVTFISSFKSAASVFLLVLFCSFFIYGMYKFEYYDTLFGIMLAVIVGGALASFRIQKYKLFSPVDYNEDFTDSKG